MRNYSVDTNEPCETLFAFTWQKYWESCQNIRWQKWKWNCSLERCFFFVEQMFDENDSSIAWQSRQIFASHIMDTETFFSFFLRMQFGRGEVHNANPNACGILTHDSGTFCRKKWQRTNSFGSWSCVYVAQEMDKTIVKKERKFHFTRWSNVDIFAFFCTTIKT